MTPILGTTVTNSMTGPLGNSKFCSPGNSTPPKAEPRETSRYKGVSLCIGSDHLAWVVQKVDNTIHCMNHYTVDSAVCFDNTYRLDSDLSGA